MNRLRRWAINGRYLTQQQTGVQRYAHEMTRSIDAALAADPALAAKWHWDLCLPPDAPDGPHLDVIETRRSAVGKGHTWEQTVLPQMARGGLLNFCNLGPLVHSRQVVCLHDANVFLEPESYSNAFRLAYRALFPLLARRARAVTTVSSFSGSSLASFGVLTHPAVVIGNGHEHALRWNRRASRFDAPDAFSRPFIFALGSRAAHKQIDLLIGLAPALDALGIDLVLSGGSASIFAATDLGTHHNVKTLGFVGDDDLAALLARALCFAFPSRTEGFGLPLLEAMVHGAPIVASDCASIPEVCGDAALYAPPDKPEVWLERFRRMVDDAEIRPSLVARGQMRCKQFSWSQGAKAYLDLVSRLSSPVSEKGIAGLSASSFPFPS